MFVYLTWNNLEGRELKTMLEYKKAELMAEKMKVYGVDPHTPIVGIAKYVHNI